MYSKLEHPAITAALETGYPYPYKEPPLCDLCREQPIDEEFYEVGGLRICEDCMIELATKELREYPEEAARLISAERRNA